jgi:hypothetical protein
MIKAEAFGHKIMRHEFVIPSDPSSCTTIIEPKLFINSHSSRFYVDGKVIKLNGVAHRKMRLDEGKIGQALKALWKVGKREMTHEIFLRATDRFGRTDRLDMLHYIKWLPSWLSDFFIKPDRWPFPTISKGVPDEIRQPKILVRLL